MLEKVFNIGYVCHDMRDSFDGYVTSVSVAYQTKHCTLWFNGLMSANPLNKCRIYKWAIQLAI